MASSSTLNDLLMQQLGFLPLSEKYRAIGEQLIGSIDGDGYIRRDLFSIANDLAFSRNLDASEEELEEVLDMIQQFDPPGIAARNLQECLILQLDRKRGNYEVASLAIQIVEDHFEDFTRKHYEKIERKLGVEEHQLMRDAISMITHLNPKPGEVSGGNAGASQYITPDFILVNNGGKLELSLNSQNAPELRITGITAICWITFPKPRKRPNRRKRPWALSNKNWIRPSGSSMPSGSGSKPCSKP
jgi:RNA polymerase sigma-54 factor